MQSIFYNRSKLITIYVSNLWNVVSEKNSTSMFANCGKLVVGNGTTYSGSYSDMIYVRIDAAVSPGYFTQAL